MTLDEDLTNGVVGAEEDLPALRLNILMHPFHMLGVVIVLPCMAYPVILAFIIIYKSDPLGLEPTTEWG